MESVAHYLPILYYSKERQGSITQILLQTLLLILLSTVCVNFYKYRKFFRLSWKLPGPVALPLLGNALEFNCPDDETFERAVEVIGRYPSPMRFWLGPKFTVIITDTEQASKVFASMNFTTKDYIYKFLKVFDGEGLISGSGPKWKRDRKLMGHLFFKRNVHEYFPSSICHFNRLAETLYEKVDKEEFNIIKYLHESVTDFVNETIVGIKTDARNGSLAEYLKQVERAYEITHLRIVKVWLQFDCTFKMTSYHECEEKARTTVHGFLNECLETVKERRKTGDKRNSMLDHMLEIQNEFPQFATDMELIHHLTTLYSASEDTVSTIASFTLMLLGSYPEIQQQLVQELDDVLSGRQLELEDLDHLTYLDMVIKEVLRLFPVAPFIMRTAADDFQLDDIVIPRNCSVVLSIQHIHRDPKNYERPNEFYPEHFLREKVEGRNPHAFVPFSAGPRGCLGKVYAYMTLKVILVTIVQKYKIFSRVRLEDIKLKTDISVRKIDKIYPIRIERRI